MVDRNEAHALPVADPGRALGVTDRGEAFRRLSDVHLDRSYRIALAILGDVHDAQDAVHDAFVRAWRSSASLRDESRFDAWFGRILVNTCRNRLRSRSRVHVTNLGPELDPPSDGDAFAVMNDRDQLRRAFETLDPDHRIVVALRFQADLQIDDIAVRLGVPAGTVKSRLHHAMRRLREVLESGEGALR